MVLAGKDSALDLNLHFNRAATLLSFSKSSLEEQEELDQLFSSIDPAAFWGFADYHGLGVRLLSKRPDFGSLESPLTPSITPHGRDVIGTLRQKAERDLARSQRQWAQSQALLRIASEKGIPVILLKGAALGVSLYGDPSYKKMNDIDLLIHPQHVGVMADLCRTQGFYPVGSLFTHHEQELKKNHHLSPLVSSDQQTVLGIHWRLASPYARWSPGIDELWVDAHKIEFDKPVEGMRLRWEHMLAHICLHLPYYKLGLRELADAYNIVRDYDLDMDFLQKTIKSWKIESAAYRTLRLATAISGCKIPTQLMTHLEISTDKSTIRDTQARVSSPYWLFHSRSLHVGRIEKAFIYFRIVSDLPTRSKLLVFMWRQSLWPPAQEVKTLLALENPPKIPRGLGFINKIFQKWVCSRRILNAMSRDYGAFVVFYLTASNILIWLQTLVATILPASFKPKGTIDKNLLKLKEVFE